MRRASVTIGVVLTAILLASSLTPAAAGGPQSRSLVRIDWSTEADLDTVEASGAPVYARLESGDRPYFLAGATARQVEGLRAGGLSVTVLDPEMDGASYYLATGMGGRPAPDWGAYGRLLLDDGAQVLLRISAGDAERLAEAGVEIEAVTLDPKPVKLAAPGQVPEALQAVTWNPTVQAMIDQVTAAQVSRYDRELAGELPVTVDGAQYTIPSRWTYSGVPIQKTTSYIGQKWADLGLNVEYHVWGSSGTPSTYPNVIGELRGSVNPDDIFIIGGHVDAVSGAPGADDNASGAVAAIIAADILSQYDWGCTLRFAVWTGEEQGLLGSKAYALRSSQRGEKIGGYLNLDMIAWNTVGSSPVIDLYYSTSVAGTQAMAQQFADGIATYGLNLVPTFGTGVTGSDHSSFWQYGYKSILGIEDNGGDWNPYYHTANDTPAHTDLTYFTEFVKASIADYAHLANCLVIPDSPPRVSIVDPVEGQTVSGVYPVRVTASDDQAVAAVELSIDGGAYIPLSLDGATYRYDWNTTLYANGSHTLTARATDSAGQPAVSPVVSVTVHNNRPPVAAFTHNCTGLSCTFNASGSQDPDGVLAAYGWNFGDGSTGSGVTASHTYGSAGTRTVVLTVTDDDGATGIASAQVTVTPGPTMHVASMALSTARSGSKYKAAADILIHDANGAAVSSATVTAVWTLPGGKTATQSKVTGRNGVAKFSTTAGAGTFRICVTAVTKAGTSYDPAANHVTCGTVTAP
jgi:PKD repeat protein